MPNGCWFRLVKCEDFLLFVSILCCCKLTILWDVDCWCDKNNFLTFDSVNLLLINLAASSGLGLVHKVCQSWSYYSVLTWLSINGRLCSLSNVLMQLVPHFLRSILWFSPSTHIYPHKCKHTQAHTLTHTLPPTSLQNPTIQWNPCNFLLFSDQKP